MQTITLKVNTDLPREKTAQLVQRLLELGRVEADAVVNDHAETLDTRRNAAAMRDLPIVEVI